MIIIGKDIAKLMRVVYDMGFGKGAEFTTNSGITEEYEFSENGFKGLLEGLKEFGYDIKYDDILS